MALALAYAAFCAWTLITSGATTPPTAADADVGATLPPMTPEQLWALREDARDMFYHAYDSYMEHGCGRRWRVAFSVVLRRHCRLVRAGLVCSYPWDEVKPLSCVGRRWDRRDAGR
jgi:hypothetical protein